MFGPSVHRDCRIAAPDALITTCAALSLSVRAVGGAIGYSIYYNIFIEKLTKKLPVLVATYSIAAGLPTSEVKTFVGTYLTVPEDAAKLPGITPAILRGALTGSEWAYAESLHYVWYDHRLLGPSSVIRLTLLS